MATSAAGGMLTGIGLGVGYGLISDYVRRGVTYGIWKLTKAMAYSKVAEIFQILVDAEKNEVTGLSTKGQVDTIIGFIDATMDLAWMTDTSIANQLFVQMIQQSVAYAIHPSHAGSIGTVANVYSGSMYLPSGEAMEVMRYGEFLDRDLRAFLSAETGLNIPSLMFEAVRGGNRRFEDVYSSVISDIRSLLNEWNDMALTYYRHWHTMARSRFEHALEMKEEAVNRAYALFEQVGNEHMSRINEQLDTLEGARSWYESGFITEDEFRDIIIRIDVEVEASKTLYSEYYTEIQNAVENTILQWSGKIEQALNDMTDNEIAFCNLIQKLFNKLFDDMSSFVTSLSNMLQTTIEDVCAYRNSPKVANIGAESEYTPPSPPLPPPVPPKGLAFSIELITEVPEVSGVGFISSNIEIEVK